MSWKDDAMGKVRDRKMSAALRDARRVRDQIEYIIKALEKDDGYLPPYSVTADSVRLDMSLAELETIKELDEIRKAEAD